MKVLVVAILMTAGVASAQSAITITAAPASLSFAWQIGAARPSAQTVQVKQSGSGPALDYTVSIPAGANWLISNPSAGKTGTPISFLVNPTSLLAGTYTATVQINAVGAVAPVQVLVSLLVKNPPPTMAATSGTLSFTYTTDQTLPLAPPPQSFNLSTNGEPVSFTAAAGSTGGWLSIDKTSGIAVIGSPVTITASVNTAGLSPGIYTGKVTVTSTNAANKSIVVNMTLTVTAGTAVIASIWPNAVPVGSEDATITIRGQHLFKASVITAGATQIVATWVSSSVLLAVIPKAILATQGVLAITVTNSPQPASNAVNFTVTTPGPKIQTIANSASFATTAPIPSVAPGEIISIFGSGLGPAQVIIASPSAGVYPSSLGTPATIVEFELTAGIWTPAPILFSQSNQVNIVVPFAMAPALALRLRLTYDGLTSTPFTFNGVSADPGLYTLNSSGAGQAAMFNFNATTSTYSINSESNPAAKGSIVSLYLTGGGGLTPAPVEGQVISTSGTPPALVALPTVTIGGDAAAVQSATAVPGSIAGLVQLNVTVPTTVNSGKNLPIAVIIGGQSSTALATMAVK